MSLKLRKALLVDDDCLTNYLNQMIIEDSGLFEHVEIAETAVEALDKLEYLNKQKLGEIEIIFLDLNMPGLNGWDFIKEYNEQVTPPNKKPMIVILSSSNNPEDKIKALYAKGVYGYIVKPLTPDKLMDTVTKYLH